MIHADRDVMTRKKTFSPPAGERNQNLGKEINSSGIY